MSVTTVETTYSSPAELAKRYERKNTKSQLAIALAKIEAIRSGDEDDAGALEAISKVLHDVTWGY